MLVQGQGLVLGKYAHGVDSGVDTVAERKVDDPVFPAECHSRLRNVAGEDAETRALPAREEHGNHFFVHHSSHLYSCSFSHTREAGLPKAGPRFCPRRFRKLLTGLFPALPVQLPAYNTGIGKS